MVSLDSMDEQYSRFFINAWSPGYHTHSSNKLFHAVLLRHS
jgi:hypothetical protein